VVIRVLCFLFLLSLLCESVQAAGYELSVADPQHVEIHEITFCAQPEKMCVLDSGQITIQSTMRDHIIYVQFRQDDSYLAVTNLGSMMLKLDTGTEPSGMTDVTLYEPNRLLNDDRITSLRLNPVVRQGTQQVKSFKMKWRLLD
jgi:hypothetical protein